MAGIDSISASALVAFGIKQSVTANNVANINNPDYKASKVEMKENKAGGVNVAVSQGSDTVEISKEANDMIATSQGFRVNFKVVKAVDEMSKELLNIKA